MGGCLKVIFYWLLSWALISAMIRGDFITAAVVGAVVLLIAYQD